MMNGKIQKLNELNTFVSYNIPKWWKGLTKDDVLAAVVGHEVSHAAIGHTRKRLEKTFLIQLSLFVGKFAANIFIDHKKSDAAAEAEKQKDVRKRVKRREDLKKYEGYRKLVKVAFDFFARKIRKIIKNLIFL